MVQNGDTYVDIDYDLLFEAHHARNVHLTLVLRHVKDTSRYGRVEVDLERVVRVLRWRDTFAARD